MIMFVLLCYAIHMSQLLSTGHPISGYCIFYCKTFIVTTVVMGDNMESQGYAVFYR